MHIRNNSTQSSSILSLSSSQHLVEDVTGPADTPSVRILTSREKEWIEKAVQKAFDELPERLVKAMQTVPPANEKVAKLYGTTVEELETDRQQAIAMIALHTVMEQVIQVRDKRWSRNERSRMSGRIDAHAREAILKKLKDPNCLTKCQAQASQKAGKAGPHYVVGISAWENTVLHRMTASLMAACQDTPPDPPIDFWKRPQAELDQAYEAFEAEMKKAFADVFSSFDQRVRHGSLDGVDHAELKRLNNALPGATPAPDGQEDDSREWLEEQQQVFSNALDKACANLPEESKAAWKNAYISQFTSNSDLTFFNASAAAIWNMRETRRQEAEKAKSSPPNKDETDAWSLQALESLQQILDEHDGKTVTLQATQDTVEVDEIEVEGNAKRLRQVTHGTFSDLREAYEGNRSGVPWKDTRRQDTMAKMAAAMLKKLKPEHHAHVLEALAASGVEMTRFLKKSGLSIRTANELRQDEESDSEEEERQFTRKSLPHKWPRIGDSSVTWMKLAKLGILGINEPKITLSQHHTFYMENTVTHELGHALDREMRLQWGASRFTGKMPLPFPLSLIRIFSNIHSGLPGYSNRNKSLSKEYADAKENKTGITAYAETDLDEFFAEAFAAYLGSIDREYSTNVKKDHADVYSPENLEEQHPQTFALIDELLRKGGNSRKAEKSLAGNNTAWNRLRYWLSNRSAGRDTKTNTSASEEGRGSTSNR